MATTIQDIETTAGFLEGRLVQLKPGLNCIIGARGTCKSTIVETLRFAFPQDAERDKSLQLDMATSDSATVAEGKITFPGAGIIRATLFPGSVRVRLTVEGEPYTVERDTQPTGSLRVLRNHTVPSFDQEHVVSRIEIYSQGELYLVAKDPEKRLALVDRPNLEAIRPLSAQLRERLFKVSVLGEELRKLRVSLQGTKAPLGRLITLKADLAALQAEKPSSDDKLDQEHSAHVARERIRERAEAAIGRSNDTLRALQGIATESSDFTSLVLELQELQIDEASDIAKFLAEVAEKVEKLGQWASNLRAAAPTGEGLRYSFGRLSAPYYEMLSQAKERQELLRKEAAYMQEISQAEQAATEAKRLEDEIASKATLRDEHRAKIKTIRNTILEFRLTEISRINDSFRNRILLSLQPPKEAANYRHRLKALLQGSSLRDQDNIANQVAQIFPPEQLIRCVENQDAAHMASMLDRDLSQVNRLLAHLAEHADLYSLEELTSDDVLDITLYDQGQPKGMAELSKGQMATALLPLILREDDCPLIIDQPEDDLDNSFIYETLVEIVQKLKHSRQIVFVTHNANLPVLGEAENVVVMEMDGPTRAGVPRFGSVDQQKDSILRLLEGGERAFEARAHKYGINLDE